MPSLQGGFAPWQELLARLPAVSEFDVENLSWSLCRAETLAGGTWRNWSVEAVLGQKNRTVKIGEGKRPKNHLMNLFDLIATDTSYI